MGLISTLFCFVPFLSLAVLLLHHLVLIAVAFQCILESGNGHSNTQKNILQVDQNCVRNSYDVFSLLR
ncbi:UV radiation resistance-associated protein [Cricetulus griseus]|nr:UV radiation resistance-associated protein [Cricetulus griseus]